MNTDLPIEEISAAVAKLRAAAGDGPATRKLIDELFRKVHNVKANASASGLTDLAAAAHEFENVLHSLRTGNTRLDHDLSNVIPADIWSSLKQEQKHTLEQSVAEGARLFVVQTDFDVADFDRRFQSLKETLSKTGEVISTSPRINDERSGKLNFRILYAARQELPKISHVTVEEIPLTLSDTPPADEVEDHTAALTHSFERFSKELRKLPKLPVESPLQRVLRAGQATALATGKEVDFKIQGEHILLDESIVNALIHLVRNAVDHGIEDKDERVRLGKHARGKIVIEAVVDQGQTRITVTDDGRGIDPAIANLVFRPGFSTAAEVTAISGRGVGLDAVQTAVKELGGSIRVNSELSKGSSFEITVPIRTNQR